MLIGNAGKDPEIKRLTNDSTIAKLSIATSRRFKDKNTGEFKEDTEWHNVIFYGQIANIVEQYIKKGSKIYIEGKIKTRKWQDSNGADRYTTEIIADQLTMLGGNTGAEKPAQTSQYAQQYPARAAPPMQHDPSSTKPEAEAFYNDDVPF
jgi:single-strand DNA-binding protein